MKVVEEADMGLYTGFRTGGRAEKLVICEKKEEIGPLLDALDARGKPYIILGKGSNTLFADDLYRGMVIMLGPVFSEIDRKGEILTCGAAASLSAVSRQAALASLSGLEFANGIPGSVGGAVYMNAGAYGREVKDTLSFVVLLVRGRKGREAVVVPASDLALGYRTSRLQEEDSLLLSAVFALRKGDRTAIEKEMKENSQKRADKQPLDWPSCGSFFKRPAGQYAGKLIEEAGLAGLTVGGAQVSPKHCGFIVNTGKAKAEDILTLMRLVQYTVLDKSGVWLEPEVRIIRNTDKQRKKGEVKAKL